MSGYSRYLEGCRTWHTMSRGVRQSPIFLCDSDREQFLSILEWALETTITDLLCYCLMDNHFHLLLEGEGRDVSRCLQLLNSHYAWEFNKRTGSAGHLFQGPFRSYRAKSASWVLQRSTYIHLNPVADGIVEDPFDYRWSSLDAFVGGTCDIESFSPSKILKPLGTTFAEQAGRYRKFIQASLRQCLAGRELTQEVMGLERDSGNGPREEIRITIDQVLTLKTAVEEVLGRQSPGTDRDAGRMRLLVSHLSRIWKLAPAKVVAVVLGCSEAMVKKMRRRAVEEIEEGSPSLPPIPEIREVFVNSPGTSTVDGWCGKSA